MQSILAVILAFFQAHMGVTGTISIWMVLALSVNIILAVKGPAAWVAWAEQYPTPALILNILVRDLGIDVTGVIQHIQDWLNSKNQPTPTPAPTEKK